MRSQVRSHNTRLNCKVVHSRARGHLAREECGGLRGAPRAGRPRSREAVVVAAAPPIMRGRAGPYRPGREERCRTSMAVSCRAASSPAG